MPRFRKKSGSWYRKRIEKGVTITEKVVKGDIVECELEDIPVGFRDTFEQLPDREGEEPTPATRVRKTPPSPEFQLKKVESKTEKDKFDVINDKTLESLNDTPLSGEDADKLIEEHG